MSYSCVFYIHTGFDKDNYPDDAGLLELCQKYEVPSIDTLQDYILPYVDVRTIWSVIQDADYCMVNNFYYKITGITMTSTDVARVFLEPDYVLSAGGPAQLEYTDGITERVCVGVASDTYGAYTEPDILTTPTQSMVIESHWYNPVSETPEGESEYFTLIESTIDIAQTGAGASAVSYTTTGGDQVVVPVPTQLSTYTSYPYVGQRGTGLYIRGYSDALDATIQAGVTRARALGVESAIVAQYQIPRVFIGGTVTTNALLTTVLARASDTIASGIQYEQSTTATIKNRRCFYGEYPRFGLLTTAGNRAEFNGETIYDDQKTSPTISLRVDVTPQGCPYYRFTDYMGEDATGYKFWANCVAGSNWKQVPLIYQGESGSSINRMVFDTEQSLKKQELENDISFMWQDIQEEGLKSLVGSIGGGIAGSSMGALAGYGMGLISGGGNWYTSIQDAFTREERMKTAYGLSAISDVTKYLAQHAAVAPELTFPFNSDIVRDAMANGLYIYRYKYTDYDIARIDKLLTMYGYKHTKALERSDFYTRPKFNYVKAHGVSVNGERLETLPRWWTDGISAQIERGGRWWHVLPDTSIYNTGNVSS